MARTRPNPSTTDIHFVDLDELNNWLSGQPREASVSLVARAALREVLYELPADENEILDEFTLLLFRSLLAAWVEAKYPGKGRRAAAAAAGLLGKTQGQRGNVAYEACLTAAQPVGKRNSIVLLNDDDLNDDDLNDDNRALEEIARDAREIVKANDKKARTHAAIDLASAKLWLDGLSEKAAVSWASFRAKLLAAEDDWDVWARWYGDRLYGSASLSEAFDIAVADLPDELWNQGPDAVNARIKELIAEHTSPEPIPTQGAGPHFALNPDLKIALALASEIDADGNNLGRIRQLLPQVRQAAGDLAGHVSPNSQPEISRILAQYREAIAAEPEAAAWGTVFGLGVRLENAATAAQREIANRLQEPLEDAAQEALDSVLTLHGPLILATAEGRELSEQADQFRLTREEQAALRDAAQRVAEALKNSNLAESAAANLAEEAVETIGEGVHPERGAAYGLATIKNVATLVVPAAVLGAVHGAVAHWIGGEAGIAFGAAAAALFGFGAAEITQIRAAARSLGDNFAQLVDIVRDQTDLVQVQVAARINFFAPFRDFVTQNEKPLRQIAENSTQMRWALRYIDFITRTNPPKE